MKPYPFESMPESIHVAVLKGGPSAEHEISLKSGSAIAHALSTAGFKVEEISFRDAELPPLPPDVDVVFPALHGRFGEDGQIQKLLEGRDLAYVGSDAAASRLIIDKAQTKTVLQASGVPVPDGVTLQAPVAEVPESIPLPCIVKPNREGSTLGLILVEQVEEWHHALEAAFAYDETVIVEEFVEGTEITVGIVAGKSLPVIEIVPPGVIFDYDAKYTYSKGKTKYLCPPETVSDTVQMRAREIAEQTFVALGARDMLRVDLIIENGSLKPVVLEANSIPGFTATSLLPKAADAAGVSFTELCRRLVVNAHERSGRAIVGV